MRKQLEYNNPYWIDTEWYGTTITLCVTDEFCDDVVKLSTCEVDGYYVPLCFIKESTEV